MSEYRTWLYQMLMVVQRAPALNEADKQANEIMMRFVASSIKRYNAAHPADKEDK